ncbi:MAG TPA: FAD-binding oxidoreductase, partial [Ktedonobacteraceae bacterium]
PLRSFTIDGVLPRLVVTPTTVDEVVQLVRLVDQHNLTMLARGNGAYMSMGRLPETVDVIIETRKLSRLLEHEAPDLTCHVEAGITLAELQKQLSTKGQRLALDPPDAEQTTIGGILATNASGPRRLRYGAPRDLVIGLRIVQADGELTRSGGRVVKNVAGYDLNKLYTGSLGTLGILVEANFKLQPLPIAERTLLLTYKEAEDAMRTTTTLIGSLLTPSAIELIDANAASNMADVHLPTSGYTLAVDFEGKQTDITRQIDEAHLIARQNNALLGDELEGEDQERFWSAVREHMKGTLTCKVSVLASEVASYLQRMKQVCQRYALEAAVVAHAGNGVLYIELRPGDVTPQLIEAITALRMHAQEARGSLVVACSPVDLKRRLDVWGEPGTNFRMMQRLKEQFDPHQRFVRGRFLGGL